MKPTRTHQLIAGFALALLGAATWVQLRDATRAPQTDEQVTRTREAQLNLTQLLSQLQDIETGARGFVVTGEPAFLEPFLASLSTVNSQVSALRTLTRDNPRQQAHCDVLERLIAQRVAVARTTVDLRRDSGFEAARQMVAGGEGKAVMDQIRTEIALMNAEEQTLLGQRTADARNRRRDARALTATATGLSFLLLVGAFALMLRGSRIRQRAQVELDRFFTLSLDMLCIAGMDGYFKRLSPAFNQTLGYTTDELLARPFLDFVHPDDRAATLAEMEKLDGGVPTIQFENRYQCQDGSWRWLSWKAQPVVEEGRLYATARDITARKRIEEELVRVADDLARFKAALDEHAIVAITDARGKITYVNDKFCAISMYAREELLGQDHRLINSGYHPEAFIRDLWHTISSGRVWQGEIKNRAKDGTFYWVATTIVPFLDQHGTPVQYVAIRADITKRKQTEEEMARLNADLRVGAVHLQEANKELESFSYSVSHDLRAPLRGIDGFSQVLLEDYADRLDEEGKDALQRVRKGATAMGELIDALLALSRVSRVELQAEPVDLSALAATLAAELRQSQPDRPAEFVIAPGMVVEADPRLLRATLANLLGNAWKYTQPRLVARIEFGCFDRDNETVYFVGDNGVGFDMTYVGKLFGAFQRLHRQTEFGGTGVGLATVQRIVHRHGGRAWAEGAVDQGATFYFTLHSPARSNIAARENAEAPAGVS